MVNMNLNCLKKFRAMWKLTVSYLSLLGYSVCSIIPRYEIQGTSVVLDCSIASTEGTSVVWNGPQQDGALYAESGNINTELPEDLENRLFVTGDQSKGNFDLRVVNAQISDEGLYNCSVQNGDLIKSYNLIFPALVTSTDASYNRYMLIDSELQKLFVGQMNTLSIIELSDVVYPVNSSNIDFLPEADKLNYCTLSHPRTPYCQNHIRFITKKSADTMILCGTNANSAKGFELNITDTTFSSSVVPCSNDPFDNFTALYANSPANGNIMYYASTSHSESTIQRPIPGTTDYMKGVISEKWMKDPQFVGSFDVDDRVFIFFRETAVETDPAEKKIYSRVAKVCKHDIGGNSLLRNKWTSYQKARLDCLIPGDIPVRFDSIQDIVMKDKVFYGVFITTTGTPASAICAFNLSSIDAALEGSFKEQTSANTFWTEVTTVPTPRPGQCTNDSMSLSESVLQFIADHPLMHKTVQPMYEKPIFVMDDEELQELELHSNMTEIVFYAASNTGKVYKLFFKNGNTYTTSTYEPLRSLEVIWTLKQHDDEVFIGTDFSVRRIRVINCEKHKWIDECVKDPHCGWVNRTENEYQWYNRCRTIEYINDNNLQRFVGKSRLRTIGTVNDVYTHENYDISIITPKSCPPEKPQFLRATQTTAYTLELRWIPGFDGGHDQTFVIQYITKTGSCVNITVNPTDSDDDPQIYELSGLQPSNVYEVKLCSKNKIGTSPHTDPIMVSTSHSGLTLASLKDDGHQVLDHSGGKALLILLFVLVIVTNVGTFVFVRKKYLHTTKDDQEKYQKEYTKSTQIFQIRQTDMTLPNDIRTKINRSKVSPTLPPIGTKSTIQTSQQEVDEE
ncbi:Hypothetical predicted protein [Mytilus galloprovincialis]|uniref:Uncharacterized protein n=2 Tax=Mytilus galloprovincialis TaxID=29158 RepID=A0A8B6DVX8_MYTGA|nr:Hypothetical predicted protein [Mytilus galloprovincialis]